MKQLGLFDRENLYARINKGGDPLVKLNKVIDWDTFMMLSEKVECLRWPYAFFIRLFYQNELIMRPFLYG